jgi:2-phosphosulfolactate phosphatase
MSEYKRVTLDNCDEATGLVVVIDVLRAFTTAPFAIAGGAERLVLVGEVEEALALQDRYPGAWTIGEVGGVKPDAFDLGNSPYQVDQADVNGRFLIQRTTAGTQGVVRSVRADEIVVASFVTAAATAAYIQQQTAAQIAFVITGWRPDGRGEEDAACADYLEALLKGEAPDPEPYLERVRDSINGRLFSDPTQPEYPAEDLVYATDLDHFDFALRVRQWNGLHFLEQVK